MVNLSNILKSSLPFYQNFNSNQMFRKKYTYILCFGPGEWNVSWLNLYSDDEMPDTASHVERVLSGAVPALHWIEKKIIMTIWCIWPVQIPGTSRQQRMSELCGEYLWGNYPRVGRLYLHHGNCFGVTFTFSVTSAKEVIHLVQSVWLSVCSQDYEKKRKKKKKRLTTS